MANDPETIAARVRQALSEDPRTKGNVIEVDYVQDVLTLRGMVGSLDAYRAAEEIARQQQGVQEVINRLRY